MASKTKKTAAPKKPTLRQRLKSASPLAIRIAILAAATAVLSAACSHARSANRQQGCEIGVSAAAEVLIGRPPTPALVTSFCQDALSK